MEGSMPAYKVSQVTAIRDKNCHGLLLTSDFPEYEINEKIIEERTDGELMSSEAKKVRVYDKELTTALNIRDCAVKFDRKMYDYTKNDMNSYILANTTNNFIYID